MKTLSQRLMVVFLFGLTGFVFGMPVQRDYNFKPQQNSFLVLKVIEQSTTQVQRDDLFSADPYKFEPGRSSGRSSSSSFGSSSFKSTRELNIPQRSSTYSNSPSYNQTYRGYSSPSFFVAPVFFWVPMGSTGPAPEGAGMGWILLLLVIIFVIFAIYMFRRRSSPSIEQEPEEVEEVNLLYERCQKNLNYLTDRYVEAQAWLERLKDKIPGSQYKELDSQYQKINLEDFTQQLKDIEVHMKRGELTSARVKLDSFDDDAVIVFEFLQEIENRVEAL